MARTTKDPKGCSLGIRVNKKTEVWLREQSSLYGMNKSEYVRAVLDSMARNEKNRQANQIYIPYFEKWGYLRNRHTK